MARFIRALKKRLLKSVIRLTPGIRLRPRLLRLAEYTVGDTVEIGEDLIVVDTQYQEPMVFLGDRVGIAPRVTLVTSSGWPQSRIDPIIGSNVGPIVIKDDAWIRSGVVILPNITVGQGAVVGAGAIVTKDVPPYTVVVGVLARPIKRIDLETGQVVPLEKS